MKLLVVAVAGFLIVASCSAFPVAEHAAADGVHNETAPKKDVEAEVAVKEAAPEPEPEVEAEPKSVDEPAAVATQQARSGEIETAHKILAAAVVAEHVPHHGDKVVKKPVKHADGSKADLKEDDDEHDEVDDDDDRHKARMGDDDEAEAEPESVAEPEPEAKDD